jgi:hypothetical protein
MADFKQFSDQEITSGPGRMALQSPALAVAGDPADWTDVMDMATYAFASPWVDAGSTEGGINMTKSFTSQAFTVDLSDGEFGEEITGHSMAIETNLAQHGDLTAFQLAWMAGDTISVVATTKESILGFAATRTLTYRSLVIVILDKAGKGRGYYFRKVTNTAGDSQMSIGVGALHLLPLKLRAFKDPTAINERAFGFIIQENNFGGLTNA